MEDGRDDRDLCLWHGRPYEKNQCVMCGMFGQWLYLGTGERMCEACEFTDPTYREYSEYVFERPDPYMDLYPCGVVVSEGSTRGRYKERFHYNERMAQFSVSDPKIPDDDWYRILEESVIGGYGPPSEFTRATVIMITRKLELQKYRERWKSILYRLNELTDTSLPDSEVMAWCDDMFDILVNIFKSHRGTMPSSLERTREGKTKKKGRHNFISYNYTQRKLLEARGIWDYHNEFPVPRNHGKLVALDDVMEKMARQVGLPFQRSVVIKRPKLRKKKKK
jgi:hypothetical protein